MRAATMLAGGLSAYLDAVSAGDVDAAVSVVVHEYAAGRGVPDVVESLLVPAQVEVGRRWQVGEWSPAAERRATAACESALNAMLFAMRTETVAHEDMPRIVMACAGGEWHSLPSRLAAAVAEAEGCAVTVLAAGTPTSVLARYLEWERPSLLALSCTFGMNLLGVRDRVSAARVAGVPVVVGGHAFGDDDVRARALGADMWAPTAGSLSALAAAPTIREDTAARPPADVLAAVALDDLVLIDVLDGVLARFPDVRESSSVSLTDLRRLVATAAAATLVDDGRVIDEFVAWLRQRLTVVAVPQDVTLSAVQLLTSALAKPAPAVAAQLAAVVDRWQ